MGMASRGVNQLCSFALIPVPLGPVAREKLSGRVILSALRDHRYHSLYKIPPSSFALLDPPRLRRESSYAVSHGSLQRGTDTKGLDRAKLLHNYRRSLAHM